MSNLSVLQRNIIQAIDCDLSANAFLKACDHTTVLDAERFALEYRALVRQLSYMLPTAAYNYSLTEAPNGLMLYILERYWYLNFGQKG